MKHFLTFFGALSLIFLSCKSIRKDQSLNLSNQNIALNTEVSGQLSKDYLSGTIKKGGQIDTIKVCNWILTIDNEPKRVLDPVNLPQEFQINKTKVWVKLRGLRRMNRCPEASPIWIEEILLKKLQ